MCKKVKKICQNYTLVEKTFNGLFKEIRAGESLLSCCWRVLTL